MPVIRPKSSISPKTGTLGSVLLGGPRFDPDCAKLAHTLGKISEDLPGAFRIVLRMYMVVRFSTVLTVALCAVSTMIRP